MRSHIGLLLLISCAAACGERPSANDVEVVDSAGVRIVTNFSADVPEWRLTSDPTLDLGTIEDGPEQFFRVADARQLSDGGVVVTNGGSGEVRVFSADGEHRLSFGRSGEGPGEFGVPTGVWLLADDSITVWDPRQRRFSVFGPGGVFARVVPLQVPVLNPEPLVVLPDGRMILAGPVFDLSDGESFRSMYSDFVLADAFGALLDSLPRQPYGQLGRLGDTGLVGSPLFGSRASSAGDAEGYWVGSGQREEVLRHDVRGTLEMVVRWPPEDRTVRAADADGALQAALDRASPEEHPRVRQIHAARPVASEFPAYGTLETVQGGGVWVQKYERPDHEGEST